MHCHGLHFIGILCNLKSIKNKEKKMISQSKTLWPRLLSNSSFPLGVISQSNLMHAATRVYSCFERPCEKCNFIICFSWQAERNGPVILKEIPRKSATSSPVIYAKSPTKTTQGFGGSTLLFKFGVFHHHSFTVFTCRLVFPLSRTRTDYFRHDQAAVC